MTISMDKKYRYRNGESARILCVDAPGGYPVVSIDQIGNLYHHTENGQGYVDYDDLIEVKEKKRLEFWVNIYSDGGEIAHSAIEAKQLRNTNDEVASACKRVVIEYEDGEGL